MGPVPEWRVRRFLESPVAFLAGAAAAVGGICGTVAIIAVFVTLVVGAWDGLVWLFKANWRTTNFEIPVLAFFVAVGFGILAGISLAISEALTHAMDRASDPEMRRRPRTFADRVIEIVSLHLGVKKAKVAKRGRFIDDLGASDVDVAELILKFEEEFQCEIPDEAAVKIATVKDAIEFVEKHGI